MKLAEKVVKPNTHCPCTLLMPKQSHSQDIWIVKCITYSFPMHPFSTPLKHQKTLRFTERVHWEQMGSSI